MNTGKLILTRKDRHFIAGMGLVRETLPDLASYGHLLHPAEKEYYGSLKFERRRSGYLLGRAAAKNAIAVLMDLEDTSTIHIDFGIFQFPVVKGSLHPHVQVSISHCNDIGIALAFPEEHPLGIDIEKIDPEKTEAIRGYLTDSECKNLLDCGLPPALGHTMIWTAKEALSKIFRTGLTLDFRMLETGPLNKVDDMYTCTFRHCIQYKTLIFHSGDHVCSIVLPGLTNLDPDQLRSIMGTVI